jgi:hypothetical protein
MILDRLSVIAKVPTYLTLVRQDHVPRHDGIIEPRWTFRVAAGQTAGAETAT